MGWHDKKPENLDEKALWIAHEILCQGCSLWYWRLLGLCPLKVRSLFPESPVPTSGWLSAYHQ
eukprot:1154114-Pelagomonas_calceolata.AAC.8